MTSTTAIISPAEAAKWTRGASNAGYHYLGCAKTFALMGKAFADANLEMMKGQQGPLFVTSCLFLFAEN